MKVKERKQNQAAMQTQQDEVDEPVEQRDEIIKEL